jgi:hypothetical protein
VYLGFGDFFAVEANGKPVLTELLSEAFVTRKRTAPGSRWDKSMAVTRAVTMNWT